MKFSTKSLANLSDTSYKETPEITNSIRKDLPLSATLVAFSGERPGRDGFFAFAVRYREELDVVTRGTDIFAMQKSLGERASELPVQVRPSLNPDGGPTRVAAASIADWFNATVRGTLRSDYDIWQEQMPKQYVKSMKKFVKSLKQEHPDCQFIFTGHSPTSALLISDEG